MRTHKWGAPAVVVAARIPPALAEKMDSDCQEYATNRTDILVYLLAKHYGFPMDSPLRGPAAEQLGLDTSPAGAAKTKPRKTRAA